jgi:hypothetical protein
MKGMVKMNCKHCLPEGIEELFGGFRNDNSKSR